MTFFTLGELVNFRTWLRPRLISEFYNLWIYKFVTSIALGGDRNPRRGDGGEVFGPGFLPSWGEKNTLKSLNNRLLMAILPATP